MGPHIRTIQAQIRRKARSLTLYTIHSQSIDPNGVHRLRARARRYFCVRSVADRYSRRTCVHATTARVGFPFVVLHRPRAVNVRRCRHDACTPMLHISEAADSTARRERIPSIPCTAAVSIPSLSCTSSEQRAGEIGGVVPAARQLFVQRCPFNRVLVVCVVDHTQGAPGLVLHTPLDIYTAWLVDPRFGSSST